MSIERQTVIINGNEVYKVGDIVKVTHMQHGHTEVYIGRITFINQDDFWLDYSKKYKANQKGFYFEDIEEIQSMKWKGDK